MISVRDQDSFLGQTKPPHGYRLTYCVGTTFSLELECLLQLALNSRGIEKSVTEASELEKFAAIQMLDVHFPTTDGRQLVFRRYTQPERDHRMLPAQLEWELPSQWPRRITAKGEMLPD